MRDVAIVVGAGGEIGAACARVLSESHAVTLCVDRDETATAAITASICGDGHRAESVVADAGNSNFAALVVSRALKHGQVRSVVHAIAHEEHASAREISLESIQRSYALGPVAAFSLFRELVVSEALEPGAALTVIGSLHARHPFANALGYNLAHAALAHLVSSLSQEWTEHGIRTNAVVPGWIRTRGEAAFYDESHLDAVAAKLPMRRFGSANDIASAVRYLASPEASYVSGSFLTVDGGLSSSLASLPGGD